MNSEREDWDDLRYLLAVARHGSLSAAARALGVNHSTVLRRISALEARVGARIFDKLPGGYVLTDAGQQMQKVASDMEQAIAAATLGLSDDDNAVSGVLRVTTIDILALYLLPRHIATFHRRHPALRLDLNVAEASLSLTRREADVAIRATDKPPEALVGRRLCTLAMAVYASRIWMNARKQPLASGSDLWNEGPWIGLEDSFNHTTMGRWLRDTVPSSAIGHRVSSLAVAFELTRAGGGMALLPCGLADNDSGLVRLTDPIAGVSSSLWLLTHDDLRRLGRVRAFLDHMAAAFASDRDLIEGRRPNTPAVQLYSPAAP